MLKNKLKNIYYKKRCKFSDFQIEKYQLMQEEQARALWAEATPEVDALLLSHALEKGLSLDQPKKEFGEDKAEALIGILPKLNAKSYEYNVSMSILKEYLETRAYHNEKIATIEEAFVKLSKKKPYVSLPAGVGTTKLSDIMKKANIDFSSFIKTRHDIRKTSDEAISEKEILKAIEMASLAPSACNRQPWKIYYSLDEKQNQKLGEIVSGNKAFKRDMKYYAAIVLDYKYFANRSDEFRQIYLNAGIILSYFTLALHSLGIGSCIMQFTGLVEDADRKSRTILKLRDSEQVMVVIGFGKYQKTVKYSKAARRSAEEIAIKY